jgi:hypothetical protein
MAKQQYALLLVAATAIGCGDGNPFTAPSTPAGLTERLETGTHRYAWAPGDGVDIVWQEQYHQWAVATLGITPVGLLNYNKYRDRAHMGQVINVGNTNGFAEGARLAIHTIWPIDNHEVIHVYAHQWGLPVALFTEGLAVAHQTDPVRGDFVPKWSGEPIHAIARGLRRRRQLHALAQLAASDAFRRLDANQTYPEAGSFVRFLIDTRGLGRLRNVYGSVPVDAPADRVRQAVLAAYGESLDDLERAWHAFLDGE